MKKIINNYFICFLTLSFVFLSSCTNNDQATGKGTLNVETGVVVKVNIAAPLFATNTTKEADQDSYSYTVTLNKPQSVAVKVYVSQAGGTAGNKDFTFDTELNIPAYETTASGTISILNDSEKEGDENFILQIGNNKTANATVEPVNVSFTIKDCYSALAGTFTYVTTNCYTPGPPVTAVAGPFSGTVIFTETASGVYSISDASFGGWVALYGVQSPASNNTAKGVSFSVSCGKLSVIGKDQFLEVFDLNSLVISGKTMTFKWFNDFGEYGTTTLTRTLAQGDWEPLTK